MKFVQNTMKTEPTYDQLKAINAELLAAVKAFASLWPIPDGCTEPKGTPEVKACWGLARAAIAKAEKE